MTLSLDASSMLAMFGSMVLLAALPSTSVLVVVARAAASGFPQGAATALGVVAGDIIYILLALFGLTLLADTLGEQLFLAKYIAAAYLIWLGVKLLKAGPASSDDQKTTTTSLYSSFLTGLLITLGDQKAVLFYLGFLPAFLDVNTATMADAGLIILITVFAVGGTKLLYAYFAESARRHFGGRFSRLLNTAAACLMIGIACFLLTTAS